MEKNLRKEKFEADKLAKRIRRQVGEAIVDFGMIEEGDRVMRSEEHTSELQSPC